MVGIIIYLSLSVFLFLARTTLSAIIGFFVRIQWFMAFNIAFGLSYLLYMKTNFLLIPDHLALSLILGSLPFFYIIYRLLKNPQTKTSTALLFTSAVFLTLVGAFFTNKQESSWQYSLLLSIMLLIGNAIMFLNVVGHSDDNFDLPFADMSTIVLLYNSIILALATFLSLGPLVFIWGNVIKTPIAQLMQILYIITIFTFPIIAFALPFICKSKGINFDLSIDAIRRK